MIKAIETKYRGYRFRSRLEARWAVFLDEMGVAWEYEKEGYNLGGEFYLPDFWLSDLGMWLEIKGEEATEREVNLMWDLCGCTGHAGMIFHGLPGENCGLIYYWALGDSSGLVEDEATLGNNGYDGSLVLGIHKGSHYEGHFADPDMENELPIYCFDRSKQDYLPVVKVEIAAEAAKAARFEHGEKRL